jgi:hypothetical protein
VALGTSFTLVASLLTAVPASSAAAATPASLPAAPVAAPAAGGGSDATTSAATTVVVLRAAASPAEGYGHRRAAEVIDGLLAGQVVAQQQVVADAQRAAALRRARLIAAAQARANRQLQKALDALAKALSTSQCTAVGGTDGEAASISCPLATDDDDGDDSDGDGTGTDDGTGTGTGDGSGTGSGDGTGTGDGTGDGSGTTEPLLAPATPGGTAHAIGTIDLRVALDRAVAEWRAAGGDTAGITARVADLPPGHLGLTDGRAITIDTDAAGWGWNRMDLLTVVRHEVGHAVGLGHTDTGLMAPVLAPGERLGVPAVLPAAAASGTPQALRAPLADDISAVEPADEPGAGPAADDDSSSGSGGDASPAAGPTADTPGADTPVADTPAPAPAGSADDPSAASGSTGTVTVTGASWSVSGATAVLDPGSKGGKGRVFYDAAADELVYARSGAQVRISAVGITAVRVRGGASSSVSINLAGLPSARERLEVDVDAGQESVDVEGVGDLTVSGGDQQVLIEGLLALLRIAAPDYSFTVTATGGTITFTGQLELATGADLQVVAEQILADPGTVIDTRGAAGSGDISLTAVASSPTAAQALVALRGTSLFGDDITLSASASGKTIASAVVSVVDSAVTASGDVVLAASADLATGAGGDTASLAAASLTDSTVSAARVVVGATNRTSVDGTAASATTLTRLTTAGVADSSIAADELLVQAAATGTLRVLGSAAELAVGVTGRTAATVSGTNDLAVGATTLQAATSDRLAVGGAPTVLASASLDNAAGIAAGATVTLGGRLSVLALADHLLAVDAGRLGIAIGTAGTSATLGAGADLRGAGDLTLTAGGSANTAVTSAGAAMVSSVAVTTAAVAAGPTLRLDGDLTLTATQDATATAAGTGTALVAARHVVTAELGRALAAGSLLATATGTSTTRAFARAATTAPVASDALVALGGLATTPIALPVALSGQAGVTADARAAVLLGAGLDVAVRGGARIEAQLGGGSAAVLTGAQGLAQQGVAVNDAAFTVTVPAAGRISAAGPLVIHAGRGPPADAFTPSAAP